MDENAYAAYRQSITLFLEARGQATPGLLSFHINRPKTEIEQCLSTMVERSLVEQCGTEDESPAYRGQPLYRLKRHPFASEQEQIERHLDGANGELLGLHRYGALTYPQYTAIADLLVEARARLKAFLQAGAEGDEG